MKSGLDEDASPEVTTKSNLAFMKLVSEIQVSREKAAKTMGVFENWKGYIKVLKNAVGEEQTGSAKEEDDANKKKKGFEDKQTLLETERNDIQKRVKEVPLKRAAVQEGLESELDGSLEKATSFNQHLLALTGGIAGVAAGIITGSAAAIVLGMAAPVLSTVALAYLAYNKVQQDYGPSLKDAEEEGRRLARELEDCKEKVRKAKGDLAAAKTAAEKWASVNRATNTIANEMLRLHTCVVKATKDFERVNLQLDLISKAYVSDAASKISPEGSGEIQGPHIDFPSRRKIETEMRSCAHVLHSLSSTYAHIYGNYVEQGFELIASFRYRTKRQVGIKDDVLKQEREQKLEDFQREATQGIKDKVYQEKMKLFLEAQKLYPQLTDSSSLKPRMVGTN
ncbi:hypothetical protein TWF481_012216 [Arthrobotrys musiformis]|uniref:Uncharacterized protein n=1 Tax=Arthrobotrys musiformis TaxID=47236 RepID=A0AAV9VWF1_9PEZI